VIELRHRPIAVTPPAGIDRSMPSRVTVGEAIEPEGTDYCGAVILARCGEPEGFEK
jgi:hypothetical protein